MATTNLARVLIRQLQRQLHRTLGMTFTKILCATDFSSGAEHAVRVAVRLARERDAVLVLLHSVYVPPFAFLMDAPFPTDVVQSMGDEGQRNLDTAVRAAIEAGATNTTGRRRTGRPWRDIVSAIDSEGFDLCVVGTHGRTGLARVLLGSVTDKVVRHSACSVLVVRPDSEAGSFKHVLVPTDHSESATCALALAEDVVDREGSITLMHAIDLPIAYTSNMPSKDFAHDLDRRSMDALEAEAAKVKSVRIRTSSIVGEPGAQTLAAIEHDRSIDLVAMGSQGRIGLERALLGSVAEKVVRHARCPVLIARPRV